MEDALDITGVEDRLRDGRPRFGADLAQLRARVVASAVHRAPATIGRYEVGESLGAGAFGTVYRAYDPRLGRRVAIKVVTVRSTPEAARVLREARMLATLSDPHVVDVFEVGLTSTQPPAPYVVMELVAGQTLKLWLATARRPWRAVVAMVRQAGLGLHAAHAAGIVHRDFKPANALIGDDGRLRVLDFGLARPIGEGADTDTDPELREAGYPLDNRYTPEITPAGHVMGTPAYMAPEAFYGEFTPASDQYSLGVALYEGLFGRRPVSAPSFEELRGQVTTTQVQLPRDTAGVPRSVCRIVRRAVSLQPQDRFANLQELVAALDAADDRTRRPPRVVLAVGAVAVAGAFGWWWSQPAPCETGAAAYDNARGDVALPDIAEQAVAQHRSEWIDAEASICRQDGEVSWNARRCLHTSLDSTSQLVATVSDGRLTDHQIARAFHRLPSPAACRAPQEGPAPSDAIKPAVADLQRRIVELWAIETTRHFDAESLAFARKLAADAESVGYAPVTAKAIYRHGRQLLLHGRSREAREQLQRAYFIAVDADAPHVAGNAATEVFRQAASRNDFDTAKEWLAHARAAFERAGIDPMTNSPFADGVATLQFARGQYAEAVETLEASLRYKRQQGRGQPAVTVDQTNRLAAAYMRAGDHAKAAEVFEQVMATSLELFGETSRRYTASLDNYGSCLLNMARPQDALDVHLRALQLRRQTEATNMELGNSHGNIALAYRDLGRHAEALQHIEDATPYLQAQWGPDSVAVGMINQQRGDSLFALGPDHYAEARGAYRRALEIFDASGPAWQASIGQIRDTLKRMDAEPNPA